MRVATWCAGRLPEVPDLPDFHIPHAEKIEWMIAERGWAVEVVPVRAETDPPVPGYLYSIGLPEVIGFPEIVVFGLTPSAATGLVGLVVERCRGGTQIPIGVEVTGLYDGGLRATFAPVDMVEWGALFSTALSWRRGGAFEIVQLLWPDRRGFMPYEEDFDPRVRLAQPVIGRFGG